MARINAGMVDPMALREVADRAPRVAPTMPSGLGRATGGPAPIASVSGARPGPIQAFMVSSEEATKISKEGGEAAEFRWLRKNRAKARLALGFRP